MEKRSGNIYLRTLSLLRPYWPRLTIASASAALYAFFSAALIWMIGPLLITVFSLTDVRVGGATPAEHVLDFQPGSDVRLPYSDSVLSSAKEGIKSFVQMLVTAPTPLQTLFNFCLLMLVIVIGKNSFNYLQGFMMAFAQQSMMRDLRNRLFNQDLSFDHFHMERIGALMSRVTNDVMILNNSLDLGFNHLVADISLATLLVSFLILLSWKLTLIAAISLPALFVFIYFIGKKIRKYSSRSQERMADVTSALEENLSNFRIVKAFGTEGKEKAKFQLATGKYFKALLRMTRITHLSSPINDTLASVAGIFLLYFAGSSVLTGSGQMDASDFMVFIVALFSLIKPAKSLTTTHTRLQEGMAAAMRIFEKLDTTSRVKERANARVVRTLRDTVEYRHVTFAYRPGEPVLRDVSFTIERGEVVALVGPSGGGKSTLADMLPRFYDPQEGAALIDGVDVRELTLDSLRSLLGIVTQETYLFNDTIAANIGYGVDTYSRSELAAAAELANAREFIEDFPDGYNTVVGNRGVRLSGGQRQRIAIARALMRNPEILIFDEATSALDTESEHLAQRAIDSVMRSRTALVVAHRLSTIRNADRILVIADGRVAESGAHEELLASGGLYRRLHDMQYQMDLDAAELGAR
ncbi:MAG: ABC transporter ATP-binding protein [Candidatus Zixiibacteriota bacterium]